MSSADFIATVKIISVSEDVNSKDLNVLKYEIIESFKGSNTDILKVYDLNKTRYGLNTPVNSKWLVFAKRNYDGDLTFDMCSGSWQVNNGFKVSNDQLTSKIQFLRLLKQESTWLENRNGYYADLDYQCLEQFNGIEETQSFALFEIFFDDKRDVKAIKALKQFDHPVLKKGVYNCIRENVRIGQTQRHIEAFTTASVLVGLYYRSARGERESHISTKNF